MKSLDSLLVSVLQASSLTAHDVTTPPETDSVVSLILDDAVAEILPDSESPVVSVLVTMMWPSSDAPLQELRCSARGTFACVGLMEGVLLSEPGGVLVRQSPAHQGGGEQFVVEWTVTAVEGALPPLSLVLRVQRLSPESSGLIALDTIDFVAVPATR